MSCNGLWLHVMVKYFPLYFKYNACVREGRLMENGWNSAERNCLPYLKTFWRENVFRMAEGLRYNLRVNQIPL